MRPSVLALLMAAFLLASAPSVTADEPPDEPLGSGADRPKVLHHGRNSITLLDTKLLRTAHGRDAFGAGRQTREKHELVDHCRHVGSLDRGSAEPRRFCANRADRLASGVALHIRGHRATHSAHDFDESHPSLVERDPGQFDLAMVGQQRQRDEDRGR